MVKIRLQRQGKKKAPFYHIVVADSRSPRDGKRSKMVQNQQIQLRIWLKKQNNMFKK